MGNVKYVKAREWDDLIFCVIEIDDSAAWRKEWKRSRAIIFQSGNVEARSALAFTLLF